METFFDSAIKILKDYVAKNFNGNASEAARSLGIGIPTFLSWLSGTRKPSLAKLTPLFDTMGATLSLPDTRDTGKDICFVNAKQVPAGENAQPPQAEDYLAAPMVGEVGAGPGYIPQEDIKSWFLVYRNLPAVRYRRNLLAVEIGAHSDSMQPTLNPGDIVLVDRDDRDVQHPGRMMLVLDPDGAGMIKRVAVDDRPDGDSCITLYSDNVVKWPPMVYSLRKDYYGDWERVIVGRVIWAWSDVREK